MHRMLHKLSAVLGIQLLELTVGCGLDPEALKQRDLDDKDDADKQATDTRLNPEHTVNAFLKLEDGLSDVAGIFHLVKCTGQVEHTFHANRISLPDEAIGCRVAISSLSMGDRVFYSSDTHPEWKTGDVLLFKAGDGSLESLNVHVDHQLASTPSSTGDVYFTVSRSSNVPNSGSRTLLAAGMEGTTAPGFRIRKTEYIGLSANGAGQFVFHLDCLHAVKPSAAAVPACNGMPLSAIRYQLVKDEYDSSLSFEEAHALFVSQRGRLVDAVADFEPFLAERKQMGGFVTGRGEDVLEGPALLHDNPNMILILQGPGPSYQYFNVDVVFTSN